MMRNSADTPIIQCCACRFATWSLGGRHCLHIQCRGSKCGCSSGKSVPRRTGPLSPWDSECAHNCKRFFVFSACCLTKQFSVHETNRCAPYFQFDYESWRLLQLSDCISITLIGVSLSGHHPCNLEVCVGESAGNSRILGARNAAHLSFILQFTLGVDLAKWTCTRKKQLLYCRL
jgi:hypothetical protein